MLVRVDNGNDPAERTHRCEICGRLYRCRGCRIHQKPNGDFTLGTHPNCEVEFRCPECPKPSKPMLSHGERARLEEL